tara:strand:- start:113 stop:223 length:111 start_codon:yes stop_codon:yes gene_type:complete
METRILEIQENQEAYQKSMELIHNKFDELAELFKDK